MVPGKDAPAVAGRVKISQPRPEAGHSEVDAGNDTGAPNSSLPVRHRPAP